MGNPYEILGVEKTADKAEIKRAYKRKAKKAHPDAGGSSAEMAELSKAQVILLDPARREKYDRTGDADAEPDNLTAAAVNNITSAMDGLLRGERDIADYKLALLATFECKKAEISRAKTPIERAIKRAEKVKARWKRKKKATGDDIIARVLDHQIASHKGVIAKIDGDLRVIDRCIEILDGYTYTADASAGNGQGFALNPLYLKL